MKIYRLILVFILIPWIVGAQDKQVLNSLENKLPFDPAVKMGKLSNGLTYYIRKNQKPEKRAELRLVVNVGSIMENESQLGLAHFMEHMCFNGTKNFEKNQLVSYLQSIGVKFGADLNAYTSFDETVYILPIPTDDQKIIDQGFQILEDWSHNVLLKDEDIDGERGVVIEEWRLGRGAGQRMRDEYLPVMFKDSRYAKRLPIGNKETLESFKPQVLKDFYNNWYRPDLMAVIVVGDIDTDMAEKKIKEHFDKLVSPKHAPKRELYPVPDHKETLAKVVSDKENTSTAVVITKKLDNEPFKTLGDYRSRIVSGLYTQMLNERLRELTQKADPPFIYGYTMSDQLIRTKEEFTAVASVAEDGVEKGIKALTIESERAKRYGFTKPELERAKKQLMNRFEKAYKERDKNESRNYVNEYISHFLQGEPAPGIEFEYAFLEKYLDGISLEEVNAISKKYLSDGNKVIVVLGTEKEGVKLPTEAEVIAMVKDASKSEVEPYVEKELDQSLIETIPQKGVISSFDRLDDIDAWQFKLSNGAKVVLKPTNFKNDQVLFAAVSKGGHSLASDEDYISAEYSYKIVNESGFGKYSKIDLQKMLAGKTVNVTPYIYSTSEGINASCSPKDMEAMFQLTYLAFTSPRKDEDIFKSFIVKNKATYQNLLSNPTYYFYDVVSKEMTQNHPRGGGFPTPEELDKIDLDKAISFYKDRFGDASDFTFFIVGNFTIDEIKPYIETYLGSLPSSLRGESWNDLGIRPPKGVKQIEVKRGADPKSLVMINFHNEGYPYSPQLNLELQALKDALNIKLIEILREEKGGVYGVGASVDTQKAPYENCEFTISFPCAPENVQDLMKAALDEVKKIQVEGVEEADLNKVKEQMKRQLETKVKENGYWLSAMKSAYWDDVDPNSIAHYQERIDKLETSALQDAAKKYFNFENYATFILYPEAQ